MQKILILNLGGKYDLLGARRIRECHVFCEVHRACDMTPDKIRAFNPQGIVITGSTGGGTTINTEIFRMGIPVLGIGLGCQSMVTALGGCVERTDDGEYGRTLTRLDNSDLLFTDLPPMTISWMDWDSQITQLPEGFTPTASTDKCSIAAFSCPERRLYGLQFHPASALTEGGLKMIDRFLKVVCGLDDSWRMDNIINSSIAQLRRRIGHRKVLLALSGGVDSSVAAALLSRAVGSQLTCIFVDHGMLRMDEGDEVEAFFSRNDMRFIRVNAAERFLSRLAVVTDPEDKRRIIGEEFVKVFEEQAQKLGTVDFLAQGTIYPDVLESGLGYADVIKSPHDMGSLPEHLEFRELIEPLRLLFKEEVRELGRAMGLPEFLISRQPFPGPGLAIRIVGEITEEKIRILQAADRIFTTELESAHMNKLVGQYFAVLTDTKLYHNRDGLRRHDYCLALRAVTTEDYLTAKWSRLPYELLDKISTRLMTQVRGVSRVVYDISNKPPTTIEWE